MLGGKTGEPIAGHCAYQAVGRPDHANQIAWIANRECAAIAIEVRAVDLNLYAVGGEGLARSDLIAFVNPYRSGIVGVGAHQAVDRADRAAGAVNPIENGYCASTAAPTRAPQKIGIGEEFILQEAATADQIPGLAARKRAQQGAVRQTEHVDSTGIGATEIVQLVKHQDLDRSRAAFEGIFGQ